MEKQMQPGAFEESAKPDDAETAAEQEAPPGDGMDAPSDAGEIEETKRHPTKRIRPAKREKPKERGLPP